LFTGIKSRSADAAAAGRDVVDAQLGAYHQAFLWVVILYVVGAVVAQAP